MVTKIGPQKLPPIWPIRGLGGAYRPRSPFGQQASGLGARARLVRPKRAEKRVRKRQNEREDTHQRVGRRPGVRARPLKQAAKSKQPALSRIEEWDTCTRIGALPGMPTETSGVDGAQAQGRLTYSKGRMEDLPSLLSSSGAGKANA